MAHVCIYTDVKTHDVVKRKQLTKLIKLRKRAKWFRKQFEEDMGTGKNTHERGINFQVCLSEINELEKALKPKLVVNKRINATPMAFEDVRNLYTKGK